MKNPIKVTDNLWIKRIQPDVFRLNQIKSHKGNAMTRKQVIEALQAYKPYKI